jgi:predicted Rdx family selenoprotein
MANKYYTSEGKVYTQQSIRSKYCLEKNGWMANYLCEAFGYPNISNDWDHSIPQARCKTLHKVELIWTRGNVVRSSRKAHIEWESYRDGKFSHHKNAYQRMVFVAMYDEEAFIKRYFCITNQDLKERLKQLFEEITEGI